MKLYPDDREVVWLLYRAGWSAERIRDYFEAHGKAVSRRTIDRVIEEAERERGREFRRSESRLELVG